MAKRRSGGSSLAGLAAKALSASFLSAARQAFGSVLDDIEDRVDEMRKKVARDLGILFMAQIGVVFVFISVVLLIRDRLHFDTGTSFLIVGLVTLIAALILRNNNQRRG